MIVVHPCHHSPESGGLNDEICKTLCEEASVRPGARDSTCIIRGEREGRTALHPPQTETAASPGPLSVRQKTHPWGVFRLKANFPD